MVTIFTLTSSLHDKEAVESSTAAFLAPLGIDYRYTGDDFSSYGRTGGLELIFVRTGGTEGLFRALFESLGAKAVGTGIVPAAGADGRVFYLLASPTSNSLAASMEILSFLVQRGCRGEILHGGSDYLRSRILQLEKAAGALAWLRGKRLGVIGKPSDWLISSDCDYSVVHAKLGVEIVDIPMSRLLALLEADSTEGGTFGCSEEVSCCSSEKASTHLPEGAPGALPFSCGTGNSTPSPLDELMKVPCREGTEAKVHSALAGADRIYRALKQIVAEEGLSGLTLRCFDLLTAVGNTGCLALARLNSEGLVATCEGDIPAMLSMLLVRSVTGESGFQCNPARMDPSRGEIVFAHCTLPLSMASSYSFDTHFESGIGVGIHGEIPEGPVTIFKVSGDLSRHFACDARLAANSYELNLCRTQVKVVLGSGNTITGYFLREPIGNHHIIVKGAVAATLTELCSRIA